MTETYTLYIDAYTPATIPMARLAEYMQRFAVVLGHQEAVHFEAVKEGSTQLAARIDREHVPKVRQQLALVERGDASPEVLKAQDELDRLLADDNATGYIYAGSKADEKIIAFPGVTRPKPISYGPFNQEGTLDGVLVSVGGADKTIHLQLQNGDIKYTGLHTDRDTARRLAKHIFEPVRVSGTGRWLREENATWMLKSFKVQSFEVLQSSDLRDAVEELRAVEGSDWKKLDDPIAALRALRDKSDGLH